MFRNQQFLKLFCVLNAKKMTLFGRDRRRKDDNRRRKDGQDLSSGSTSTPASTSSAGGKPGGRGGLGGGGGGGGAGVVHVDLPPEVAVGVALVVEGVWCAGIRGPLQDAGLAFLLAVQVQGSLEGAEAAGLRLLARVLGLPLAQPPVRRGDGVVHAVDVHAGEHLHRRSFLGRFARVPALGVVSQVEGVGLGRVVGVVARLHHKGVGLAPHHVDLGDQEAVHVVRDAPAHATCYRIVASFTA